MHLTCYLTRHSSRVKPEVRTTDQFGEQYLTVLRQRSQVCVPTTQTGSEQAVSAAAIATVDHFDMYRAKTTPRTPRFERQDVTVVDQWIDETVTVKKPWRLGVPTDKNEEGIGDPDTHLNCYLLKAPSFKRQDVEISNQFGDFVLTVRRPQSLCVPSEKEVVGNDR